MIDRLINMLFHAETVFRLSQVIQFYNTNMVLFVMKSLYFNVVLKSLNDVRLFRMFRYHNTDDNIYGTI